MPRAGSCEGGPRSVGANLGAPAEAAPWARNVYADTTSVRNGGI